MSFEVRPVAAHQRSGAQAAAWWPAGLDPVVFVTVLCGFALLCAPTFWDWSQGGWAGETQGHEALILALSAWLLYRQREPLIALRSSGAPVAGGLLFVLGLLLYVFGRSQEIVRVELLSLIVVLAAVLLRFKGWAVLRVAWFPLLFMLFALPLPFMLVMAVTGPLKTGVSAAATELLLGLGYPMGRSGVVITIGQYELLVTEACAGLQTMFTLEAMGLLYVNLTNHAAALRKALLAVLVVPIAFCANVIRVVVLALVTYYLGDAAGQGFLHGFAGMVLFLAALVLIVIVDSLLGRVLPARVAAR